MELDTKGDLYLQAFLEGAHRCIVHLRLEEDYQRESGDYDQDVVGIAKSASSMAKEDIRFSHHYIAIVS